MLRMRSGHRAVDTAKWVGGDFPVPASLRVEHHLKENAFNLSAQAAYMESNCREQGKHAGSLDATLTVSNNRVCSDRSHAEDCTQVCLSSENLRAKDPRFQHSSGLSIVDVIESHGRPCGVQMEVTDLQAAGPDPPAAAAEVRSDKTQNCEHPSSSIVEGANQYGSCQRCLMPREPKSL